MQQEKNGVSIFIITYLDSAERGEILEAICRNALAQNYDEFEVVVSDNAGSYPAKEALKGIDDSRLRIFRNEKNLGFSGNINTCVERCRYDIIKLNCDDDLLHPDFLKVMAPLVADDTFAICDMDYYTIGKPPEELSQPLPAELKIESREPGYGKDIWDPSHIALPGCTIFTKHLFKSLGKYDGSTVIADYDFLLEVRMHRNVKYVRHNLCYMGVWDQSITRQARKSKPYFFQTQELYTKIRFIKCKSLSQMHRFSLSLKVFYQFCFETARVLASVKHANYRSGYRDYFKRLCELLVKKRTAFGYRPENRI